MDYIVVIPSYKRSEIILTHTLNCLLKTDIKKDIYIFVADENEKKDYENTVGKKYNQIKIIVGVRGIPNQRNYIQKYFPKGKWILFIDDDIEKIIGLDINGKRVEAKKLNDFIIQAFQITEKIKLKMWGINTTNSNLEMKNQFSVGRIYIVGNFYGLINCNLFVDEGDEIIQRKNYTAGKESHERALKMFEQYGGVIKFRQFGVVSKYWGVKGGHQISRNNDGEKAAAIYLNKKYNNWTTLRIYNGIPDLKIKPQTKVFNKTFVQ